MHRYVPDDLSNGTESLTVEKGITIAEIDKHLRRSGVRTAGRKDYLAALVGHFHGVVLDFIAPRRLHIRTLFC